MVTNNKKYMSEYMSKYNLTDKCRKYKMDYYWRNKEKIKGFQRYYYHKYKSNPEYSHSLKYNNNSKIEINNGNYIIEFS